MTKIRSENADKMRQAGIRRKQQTIMKQTSAGGKEVLAHMIATGAPAYQAAKEVIQGDRPARAAAREVRNNGPLMELAFNGRNLKLTPAIVLLAKANTRLEEFLDKDMVCPKCDEEFEINARNLLDAVKTVHASLKQSGALSQYEQALSQDVNTALTTRQIAEQVLRLETEESAPEEG